ncbi:MAG: hypothetical protein M3552_00535 [Planctomycetota bacterium]|nr:hypothetical protein [Planctomycetota bacterium]
MPETLPLPVDDAGRRDAELLRTLSWNSEPKRLAAASKSGDVPMFARETRRELRRRFGTKGVDANRLAARYPLHESLAAASSMRVADPGGEMPFESFEKTSKLIRLAALLDGLRLGGSRMSDEALWPLWSEAWLCSSEMCESAVSDESPLVQILIAEATLASGILFDGAEGMRSRRKLGRTRLIAELEARTDTDGTPHADLLPLLPAWFASVARCAHWARGGRLRLWNAEYSGRFDGLVRAVATLTGPDGRIALAETADVRPALAEALKCAGWKRGSAVGDLVNRLKKADADAVRKASERPSVPHKIDKSSPPVVQSDWAKLVVSRSRWRPNADLLAIAHHVAVPSIEFVALGHRIFSGEWGLSVRLDGEALPLTGECDAVSWFSDKDADYVELQWTTEPGIVICRQALLTRGDHQFFVADSISAPGRPEARIETEMTLPLATAVVGESLRPGRELRLNGNGLSVRCLPIALPMDRIDRGTGSFEPDARRLVMKQSGIGGIYAPLLFDWHPHRRDVQVDWRNLTVTENGQKVRPDAAVGCRARLGKRQLLVYRNLNGSKAKRAVLGHHHDHETVIGRFTNTGEVDPLVYVE